MEKESHYQQGALNLTAPGEDELSAETATAAASGHPERPTTQFHTLTPAGRRLPDSLWEEYRLEVEFREEHGMPQVSLEEFADMRDWADREPPHDVAWAALPHTVYERKKT